MEAALRYFFPGDCYQTVVENHEFGNDQCLKFFYSRFLSLTIIIGALIVKVPQILKVIQAGSAEGLSYVAIILELLACTFTSTYNFGKGFPFSSWGESFFIAVQVVVLIFLVCYYNNHLVYVIAAAPAYAGMVWYLTSEYASMELLSALQTSVIPLMVFSRMTQIYTTFSNKSTGQLSLITSFMNWAGTASRVFTTVQETEDPIMLVMFISMFCMNGIILLQFVIYRNSNKQKSL